MRPFVLLQYTIRLMAHIRFRLDVHANFKKDLDDIGAALG